MRGRLQHAFSFAPDVAVVLAGILAASVALGGLIAQRPLLATAAAVVAGLAVAFLARPDLATATVLFVLMTNASGASTRGDRARSLRTSLRGEALLTPPAASSTERGATGLPA